MTDPKAAASPVAWLIRWTERDTPCSMLVDGDPGPAAEDETITPLYAHPPAERIALLESLLRDLINDRSSPYDVSDEMYERIRAALEGV